MLQEFVVTLQGWVVASDSVMETSYTVRGLQPDTSYMFLVRAQNSHGLSLPSPVTSAVRTRGDRANSIVLSVSVCLSVCLSVSNFAQKLPNGFA